MNNPTPLAPNLQRPLGTTTPNGGRPTGGKTGRALVLQTLDGLLATEAAQRLIHETLQQEMIEDPMKFLHEVVFPLMPKEQLKAENVKNKLTVRIIQSQPQPKAKLVDAQVSSPSTGHESPALPPPSAKAPVPAATGARQGVPVERGVFRAGPRSNPNKITNRKAPQ